MVPYWLNSLIGFVTLGAEIGLAALTAAWCVRSRLHLEPLFTWLRRSGWALIVGMGSTVAVAMSLYYEFSGFPPCFWCWMARVFFYPLPLLLLVAWFRQELPLLAPYVLSFSFAGMAVTLYQHLLQMNIVKPTEVCGVSVGIDCAQRWFFELGHITFPWVGFVMFAWFAFVSWLASRATRHTFATPAPS